MHDQTIKPVLSHITEVQVVPIRPKDGLVGFASVVFNNSLYLGSIGIMTRPTGGYRLAYPTKNGVNIFHPINGVIAKAIEDAVIERLETLLLKEYA